MPVGDTGFTCAVTKRAYTMLELKALGHVKPTDRDQAREMLDAALDYCFKNTDFTWQAPLNGDGKRRPWESQERLEGVTYRTNMRVTAPFPVPPGSACLQVHWGSGHPNGQVLFQGQEEHKAPVFRMLVKAFSIVQPKKLGQKGVF